MANKVVHEEKKVWIENEDGQRLSEIFTIQSDSHFKVTKNFLEITVKYGFSKKKFKKRIININALEVLYKEVALSRFGIIPFMVYNDYVYFNKKKETVYDFNNNLVLSNVERLDTTHSNKNITIAIIKDTEKCSVIYNSTCVLKDIYICDTTDSFVVISDGNLSIYETENMTQISSVPIQKFSRYYMSCISNRIIHLTYLNEKGKVQKREFRQLSNLKKTFELDADDSYVSLFHDSKNKILFDLSDRYRSYSVKIFDYYKWEWFEGDEKEKKYIKLVAFNGKIYHVFKYSDNVIKVYSEDYEFIFSCNATDITMSQKKDFFIIKSIDLTGIITLDGKTLLEPIASEITENLEHFFYKTAFGEKSYKISKKAAMSEVK